MSPTPVETVVPRTSVILIVRNQVEALRRSLAALERAAHRELFEILVVDKASRDGSGQVDHEYPDVQVLRLPKDFGATRALNIAVRTARGEYLFFLPVGAEVSFDTIDRLMARMSNDQSVGGLTTEISHAHPLPNADDLKSFSQTGVFPRTTAVTQDEQPIEFPRHSPLFVRRAFIVSMNYFDERYGEFGPYLELCFQIKAAGKKILAMQSLALPYEVATEDESAPYAVDRVHGSALYLSKHGGSGMGFRIGQALGALGSIFSFRSLGYDFQRLTGILGGQKIDGNQ